MTPSPGQVAADWVAYARCAPTEAPEDVFKRGWVIYDLAYDNPALGWEAIKLVLQSYPEADLLSENDTEAKSIFFNTAAGPFESLLAQHGSRFIDAVEQAARDDRRIRWALGGVWQNSMTDEVWSRVQIAAGEYRGL